MFQYKKKYDVLVIGAGHAGTEAALASARMGCKTAILTQNLDTIGAMSCNPAIGGLAKGHMVREIDALGGGMGLNTDATAIQWKMLNSGKGPSVRAPRAQVDKKAYQFRMKWILENQSNLDIHQGNVAKLLVKESQIYGVETSLQMEIHSQTVILSAGTFMRGLMHVGLNNERGGRMGDSSSTISNSLEELGFNIERFKTGTPCRINGRSVDFSRCEAHGGDHKPPHFSYLVDTIQRKKGDLFTLNPWGDPLFHVEQVDCYMTYTNEKTHSIIKDNLDKSPMYSGKIDGVGPRYCPSIEDKVVRFSEKPRHQVFLEPEGRHTNEFYVNGVSTSLPYDVQYEFIRSIEGLENAEIIRPGYAVEYDYCPPTQLHATLETQSIQGLYFAGQINGTSGYEEAGAQGLMAGVNAALKVKGENPFVLGREEAYIGVMIDDLVTKGCIEPYRMFTSRAEFRLLLRQDTADLRLTPRASELGLVCDDREQRVKQKMRSLQEASAFIRSTTYEGVKLDHWFRRDSNTWIQLPDEIKVKYSNALWTQLEVDFKYEGHVKRQQKSVSRITKQEQFKIPADLDYSILSNLKQEASQRLSEIRPSTLGQASRISGITPADLSVLAIHLRKVLIKG